MIQKIDAGTVWSARAVFLILGMLVSVWAALVPYVKLHLGVDEGTLGMLLLCIGIGAVCAMPCAGTLAGRFGCRMILLAGIPAASVVLLVLIVIDSVPFFAAGLLAFGMLTGIVDVVMNIQAVFVEKKLGRAMMSSFHAMYSLGGIAGGSCMALVQSCMGLTPLLAVAAITIPLCGILLFACGKHLLPYGTENKSMTRFVLPQGIILLLGVLCFFLYMGEGVVLDWGGLFLAQERAVPLAQAGLAFALFSVTTTLGRLAGDRLVQLLGARALLVGGGLMAASGYLLMLTTTATWCAFVGFCIVGLGSANMIPQLFSHAARQQKVPANIAIASVTTVGYMGLLAGPALMGFVAHELGLAVIFMIVAMLMALVSIVFYMLK